MEEPLLPSLKEEKKGCSMRYMTRKGSRPPTKRFMRLVLPLNGVMSVYIMTDEAKSSRKKRMSTSFCRVAKLNQAYTMNWKMYCVKPYSPNCMSSGWQKSRPTRSCLLHSPISSEHCRTLTRPRRKLSAYPGTSSPTVQKMAISPA